MKDALQTREYGSPAWGNPMSSPYWRIACLAPDFWNAPRAEATYVVSFLPLLGGQTLVDEFDIKAKGAFVIYGLSAFANNPAAAPPSLRWGSGQTSGLPSRALIQITDSTKDYKLFSKAIPLDNIAGGAGGSSGAWIPYVAEAGTTITVQLTSLNVPGVSEDWNWWLGFHGAELAQAELEAA